MSCSRPTYLCAHLSVHRCSGSRPTHDSPNDYFQITVIYAFGLRSFYFPCSFIFMALITILWYIFLQTSNDSITPSPPQCTPLLFVFRTPHSYFLYNSSLINTLYMTLPRESLYSYNHVHYSFSVIIVNFSIVITFMINF